MDFSSDAHVRLVATTERSRAKAVANNLLAVPDSADSKKWFVWHVVEPKQTSVANVDELMATCAHKNGVADYFCDRRIVGPDYSVSYSFVAGDSLPVFFESLDERVIDIVEGMRCRSTNGARN